MCNLKSTDLRLNSDKSSICKFTTCVTHCDSNSSVSEIRFRILSAKTQNSHGLPKKSCVQISELVNSTETFSQAKCPISLHIKRALLHQKKNQFSAESKIIFIIFTPQKTEFTEAKHYCEGQNIIIPQCAD